MYMKSRTGGRACIAVILGLAIPNFMYAQSLTITNPGEYVEIEVGTANINKHVSNQGISMGGTAALQAGIGWEFKEIKGWERKYAEYLKNIQGFAEGITAASTFVADGVDIMRRLFELKNVVQEHPVGVLSTAAMNDLYVETFMEFMKCYNIMKFAVKKTGKDSMLSGAEKRELLWRITDELQAFNNKLKELVWSVAYYNMTDVWNKATAGMMLKDRGQIAREALERWKRVSKAQMLIHDSRTKW